MTKIVKAWTEGAEMFWVDVSEYSLLEDETFYFFLCGICITGTSD